MMSSSSLLKPWNPETLELALTLLRAGDVVGVPTETVYGLAGIAWNPRAVARIFAAKQRPSFDPLIAHIPPSWRTLEDLEAKELIRLDATSESWRQTMRILMQKFWPGPLTLLMPRHPRVCELACSGLPHVAVRMPAHPVFQELLEALQSPLAAPSANRFGRISPTRATDVISELGEHLPLVIDGGQAILGVESTILHANEEGRVTCLRLGASPLEDFTKILGYRPELVSKEHPTLAPGMLERHYAPGKNLWLLETDEDPTEHLHLLPTQPQKIAVLHCGPRKPQWPQFFASEYNVSFFCLSTLGDDRQGAQHLFPSLRDIDDGDFDLILAEAPPQTSGLWPAIRDRLQRAAIKKSQVSP